jgi:hypothetical protein
MKTTEISYEEFCAWVQKQDDERPVNMEKAVSRGGDSDCGCVMVEFAKELKPDAIGIEAYLSSVCMQFAAYDFQQIVFSRNIFKSILLQCKRFGELKKHFI